MAFVIQHVDVLALPADALIYSTNVNLLTTGGVGAQLREKYGWPVQEMLTALRGERRHVSRGEFFEGRTPNMPWNAVYHTVPTDGLYDTAPQIVEDLLSRVLRACAAHPSVRTVAMSALATGYGHLRMSQFLDVYARLAEDESFAALQQVTLCLYETHSVQMAVEQLRGRRVQVRPPGVG